MKAVSWGRGFFRLWMLLAVLWVGFALLVGWGSVANPYVPSKDVAIITDTEAVDLLDSYGEVHQAFEERVRVGTTKKTALQTSGFNLYTGANLEPWKYYEYIDKANARVAEYVDTEAVTRRSQAIPQLAIGVVLPPGGVHPIEVRRRSLTTGSSRSCRKLGPWRWTHSIPWASSPANSSNTPTSGS